MFETQACLQILIRVYIGYVAHHYHDLFRPTGHSA